MEYRVGNNVLNDWQITKLIGEGANGKVFEIEKSDFGVTTKSALKVITIPKSMSDVKAAMTEGMDENSVTEYFRGFVHDIVKEIAIMSELKGHSNIVSYEDHCVIPHEDTVGWDILIRMELLTPMSDYLLSHKMTEKEVIQLGCDMCNALDYCQKKGLIHRDIKPENIFVNEEGRFKLGDFGIARAVEKTMGGLSKKGTESYMAPEVYLGKPYGATVDIYSVGLVLYKLMNNNRLPFLPPSDQPIRFEDRENALIQRMSGKAKIPSPTMADKKFSKVILKACAFEPKDRYHTPEEMLDALKNIVLDKKTQDKPVQKLEVEVREEIEEEKTLPAEDMTVYMEEDMTIASEVVEETKSSTEGTKQDKRGHIPASVIIMGMGGVLTFICYVLRKFIYGFSSEFLPGQVLFVFGSCLSEVVPIMVGINFILLVIMVANRNKRIREFAITGIIICSIATINVLSIVGVVFFIRKHVEDKNKINIGNKIIMGLGVAFVIILSVLCLYYPWYLPFGLSRSLSTKIGYLSIILMVMINVIFSTLCIIKKNILYKILLYLMLILSIIGLNPFAVIVAIRCLKAYSKEEEQ